MSTTTNPIKEVKNSESPLPNGDSDIRAWAARTLNSCLFLCLIQDFLEKKPENSCH